MATIEFIIQMQILHNCSFGTACEWFKEFLVEHPNAVLGIDVDRQATYLKEVRV